MTLKEEDAKSRLALVHYCYNGHSSQQRWKDSATAQQLTLREQKIVATFLLVLFILLFTSFAI